MYETSAKTGAGVDALAGYLRERVAAKRKETAANAIG